MGSSPDQLNCNLTEKDAASSFSVLIFPEQWGGANHTGVEQPALSAQ